MKPTSGRIKRVAATGAAAGLAVLGLGMSSHGVLAGGILGQPSAACTDNQGGEWIEEPILTGPISLSVEVGDNGVQGQPFPAAENVHVAVCYSDTAPGTPSNLAGGYIGVFGPQVGGGDDTPQVFGACLNDAGAVFQVQCAYRVGVSVTPTAGPCGLACGATVTVSIPVQVCAGLAAGVHQVGPNCSTGTLPVNQTVNVGASGLIVSSFGIGPGPNGTLGATTPTTTVSVDGISEPLTAGAGVGLGTIGAGTTNGANNAICLGPFGCPGAWVATSGAPLAWLVLPVVGAVPLNPLGAPSPECFEVNSACPAPPYSLP